MSMRPRPRVVRSIALGAFIGLIGVIAAWEISTDSRRVPDAWQWAASHLSTVAGRVRWGMTLSSASMRRARTMAMNVGLAEAMPKERIEARPVPFLDTSLQMSDIFQGLPATIERVTDGEASRRALIGFDPDFRFQRYGVFMLEDGGFSWSGIDFWLCRRLYQTDSGVVSSSTDVCLKLQCEPAGHEFRCEVIDGWIS